MQFSSFFFFVKYVKTQTPEICMAAVKKHGCALKYVKTQTPKLCMAAVKRNSLAFRLVNRKFMYLIE